MAEQLPSPLPCPFCGSFRIEHTMLKDEMSVAMQCRECHASGPPFDLDEEEMCDGFDENSLSVRQTTMTKWNTRVYKVAPEPEPLPAPALVVTRPNIVDDGNACCQACWVFNTASKACYLYPRPMAIASPHTHVCGQFIKAAK